MKKTILLLLISLLFVFPVSAVSVKQDKNNISLRIPSGFVTITSETIGKNSSTYEKYISKSEATKRFVETADGSQLLIDAISTDKKSEIKVNVRKADKISNGIVDFSLLKDNEKAITLSTLLEGFNKSLYNLNVLSSMVVTHNNYSFMKITARQGTTVKGYCFTSYITILDSKYYELTFYHSTPALSDTMISSDETIFSSLKIKDSNSGGLGVMDIVLIILTSIAILVAVLVGIFIAYSFYDDYKKRRRAPEIVRLRKR